MASMAASVGRTTAEKGGRAARFSRGVAVIAALALALVAALALSEEASAHGTGYYGSHSHGYAYCDNYGRIKVMGLQAAAYNGYIYGHSNSIDQVYYRAHLYRWNSQGQYWAYVTTDGWAWKTVNTGGNPLVEPTLTFAVPRGTWRVSTELLWYDHPLEYSGNKYLGSSPNAWAQGTCTY